MGIVLRRVLKNVGKVRVGLNKIGLKFREGKTLVISEKASLFVPTFPPDKIIKRGIKY